MKHRDSRIELRVEDDGIGVAEDSEQMPFGYGVLGMRERLLQLGGQLVIERVDQSGGTRIRAMVPIGAATR